MKNENRRVALVTGAGDGLGKSIALHLAGQGYDVIVHYHKNSEGADQVVSEIHTNGGRAEKFAADLARSEQARELSCLIDKKFGTLDVLVNNAGVYHMKNIENLTDHEWFEGFNTTATATFLMTRFCLPYLRKSTYGRVVNIGDSSCDRIGARDLSISYHIGKTGTLLLTKSFAKSEAPNKITVNMISPGCLENSIDNPSPVKIPAGRLGKFSDILQALDFVLDEKSNYFTGSNLIVSGGWNLR